MVLLLLLIFIRLFGREEVKLKTPTFETNGNRLSVEVLGLAFQPYGNKIIIHKNGKEEVIQLKGKNKFNIYQMDLCNMDGEEGPEIIFGVNKKAPHHHVKTKRIFIYGYGKGFYPIYRCSRLYLPMEDFIVHCREPQGEIIAIVKKDSQRILESFIYSNFGFHSTGQFDMSSYKDFKIKDGNLWVKEKEWKEMDLKLLTR